MVKVTVTLGSNRPGGVDVALCGLLEQTYEDFEVIFVDGRYHKRHKKVLDYVKAVGFNHPFYHVPNHRNNRLWGTPGAGFNTGFMLAAGEIVIMLLDYAYAPPGWIENHLKHHDKKRLVMAPHLYTEMPQIFIKAPMATLFTGGEETTIKNILAQKEAFYEIGIFAAGAFESPWLKHLETYAYPNQDPKVVRTPGPVDFNLMHTKNDSFPLETVLDINGADENFDRGRGPGDTEFGWRFSRAGCEPWLSHDARVYCLNPRGIMPNLNITIPMKWPACPKCGHPQPPEEFWSRWSYDEGMEYYKARQASIIAGDLNRANNPYSLRKKRDEIWEWRELSQEEEAVIPFIEIPDEVYFR